MADDKTDRARENQRNLRRLLLSIKASYGRLNLLMALSDNWKHRDELIQNYETELQARGTHCYRVRVDRQQPSLKQCLIELAEKEANWGSDRTLVTVLGADELLGVRLRKGERSSLEKFFFSLQWTREALRHYQFPVVLWLTPQIAGQLAQLAPDFWSWRGGVFEFSQPIAWTLPNRLEIQTLSATEREADTSQAVPEDIERQIAELEAQDAESPLLASLYMELGAAYEAVVQYTKAAKAYEQAVKLRETQLGPDHPATATSLNNLALLYKLMGRYNEAEPLYARALAIHQAHLDPESPIIAASLNNLAALYESMGRYSEAEPLYVNALFILETQLGSKHSVTATSLNNLAGLYKLMGRKSEAEPLYIRSLEIIEAQLGPDHPTTATSLNNLAGLYESMGRYSEAESLYIRAIAILEKSLPPEHPYISSGKANFRSLLRAAIKANQTDQLSDHPLTQALLQDLHS
ncbi:MAG: tetratricopeptide repeat protein [Leptolyngbyaceae cyanobacterium]